MEVKHFKRTESVQNLYEELSKIEENFTMGFINFDHMLNMFIDAHIKYGMMDTENFHYVEYLERRNALAIEYFEKIFND